MLDTIWISVHTGIRKNTWMNNEPATLGISKHNLLLGLPRNIALGLLVAFALALLAYVLVWPQAPVVSNDSTGYFRTASDLVDLRIDDLQFRAPGYPLVMMLTGASQGPTRALFITSILLHFAATWMLAAILYRVKTPRALLVLFGLVLLLPPYLESTAKVLAEELTGVMLAVGVASLAFWFISRKMFPLIIAALTFGYSTLVRPNFQAVFVAVAIYVLAFAALRPRALKLKLAAIASMIVTVGGILFVGGYSLFNFLSFGTLGTRPAFLGPSLTTQTALFVERLPDEHAEIREVLVRYRDANLILPYSSHTSRQYFHDAEDELYAVTGMSQKELYRYLLKLNLLLIRENPLNFMWSISVGFVTFWQPYTSLSNFGSAWLQGVWSLLHIIIISVFVVELIVIGGAVLLELSRRAAKRRSQMAFDPASLFVYGLAGSLVTYTVAISTTTHFGEPRYRVPIDMIVALMCVVGAQLWWQLLNETLPENAHQ